MNKNQPISEELLGKFLANETDANENILLENWLNEKEENRKELADYEFIWKKLTTLTEEKKVDTEAAWNKLKTKINTKEDSQKTVFQAKKQTNFISISMAASVVLLLSISIWWFTKPIKPNETITLKTLENTQEKTLPDGSTVFMNQNTSLSYSTNFEGDSRKVMLNGEAFFTVKRNEQKPFIIDANGLTIKVLGTVFNIKAYDKNVKVAVESGKVAVAHKNTTVLLLKNEEVEVKNDTLIKALAIDKNAFSYKTKIYTFEDSSLEQVAKVLSNGYHTKIILKNKNIKICRLTTSFKNETLPNALNVIAETLNLSIENKGNKFIIDGEGCK